MAHEEGSDGFADDEEEREEILEERDTSVTNVFSGSRVAAGSWGAARNIPPTSY